MRIECIHKAIAASSTTGDHFVFEVFCKAIAFGNVRSAIAHSSTTGDRFAFEVFCKAIAFGNVRSAIALTLSQQAIALFLRFSVRRSLLGMYEVRSHSLFHNK
ncbi:hypothetical protein [Nostoc sp.]|uniref:hypothetical protein n=1 Tax=Nostoc sp. TaxID=1180 RepID=UPI002FF722FC